jgi:HlyD family secretion protein
MASKRTRILVVAAAVVLVGGAVAGSVIRDNRKKVTVQTGKVSRKDLVSIVSASGEVKPKRYVNIGANVSGRIIRLSVKEGDRVKSGQVLAKIESTRFEAGARQSEEAVRAARADLARAEADVDVARLAFDRTKRMHDDKLVADQTYDQADADLKMRIATVEANKRRIAQLQAGFESVRDDLEKTTVTSPMEGVVTSLPKEEGEVVIGAQSFSPTVIMTVADLSVMEAEVMVDETDIRSLRLGLPAEIRVDALEGLKIKGEVTEIGASAVVRGTSQTAGQTTASGNTGNQAKDFKVTVTLKDPPPSLRPGLNATADITTAKKESVVAVPIQSVVVREVNKEGKVVDPDAVQASDGSSGDTVVDTGKRKGEEKEGVFLRTKDKVEFRPVKTGIVGETDIEIVDGVQEGEEIVTGSYKTLRTLKADAKIKVEAPKKDQK